MKTKKIDMELTTTCNAKCKFCPRETYGIDFNEIGIESLKTVLSPTLDSLDEVWLSGSFGDAVFYPHLFELLDFLGDDRIIYIMTNASGGNNIFWNRLAEYSAVTVIFALDGLKDSHELYRKISYKNVIDNMTTYLSNGGTAMAQMLIFKHNEHEVEAVKTLVEGMGASIYYRISRKYDDELKRPEKYSIKTLYEMSEGRESVYCQFIEENFIYMTSQGEIMPCCHYHPGRFLEAFGNDQELNNMYNISRNDISIYKSDVQGALRSPLFSYIIERKDSLPVCMDICRMKRDEKMSESIRNLEDK